MQELKPYLNNLTEMPEKFLSAEKILLQNDYVVTRLVRVFKQEEKIIHRCYGLSVFGSDYGDAYNLQQILGNDYKLVPDFNNLQIIIK